MTRANRVEQARALLLDRSVGSPCNLWIALVLGSCVTAPTRQTTTSTEPSYRARPGVIESVDEIEEDVESTASDDVLVGLLVGGLLFSALLFDHGTGIIVGVSDSGAPIVPPDGVSTTLPHYQVLVRFDDGGSTKLVYTGDVPFHRGERVMLTQQGLVRT
ncbi:MAG: putative outer rane lipoprotein [Myxococcales bacterium]|nr:putative outer rane lipoprotein [Myxococcales bacterium]